MGQEEPSCDEEGSNIDWHQNPNQALVISEEALDAKGDEKEKGAAVEKEKVGVVDSTCKGFLSRSGSDREECR